mmetsp:Transcript_16784/g.19794  ORF Transcript_16784/g.19794 Transcript_16784/m.19794 type:complete len:228 (-) Transcript_16784:314-997(-)
MVSSRICSGSLPAVSTNRTVTRKISIPPALHEYMSSAGPMAPALSLAVSNPTRVKGAYITEVAVNMAKARHLACAGVASDTKQGSKEMTISCQPADEAIAPIAPGSPSNQRRPIIGPCHGKCEKTTKSKDSNKLPPTTRQAPVITRVLLPLRSSISMRIDMKAAVRGDRVSSTSETTGEISRGSNTLGPQYRTCRPPAAVEAVHMLEKRVTTGRHRFRDSYVLVAVL